ncbi:MAG: hypothetical protein ACRDHP_19280, partial [Ktedonobacterales bacterium]
APLSAHGEGPGVRFPIAGSMDPLPSVASSHPAAPLSPQGEGPGVRIALALSADRLELARPPGASTPSDTGDNLCATLRSVADSGPFFILRLALMGAPAGADPISVTCSRREWAALRAMPGDSLTIRVPDGAACLVARTTDTIITTTSTRTVREEASRE